MTVSTYTPNTHQHAQPTGFKHLANQAIDWLYGTKARTNRTIFLVVGAVASAKALDALLVAPYCSV